MQIKCARQRRQYNCSSKLLLKDLIFCVKSQGVDMTISCVGSQGVDTPYCVPDHKALLDPYFVRGHKVLTLA